MKKLFAILLAAMLLFTACGGGDTPSTTTSGETKGTESQQGGDAAEFVFTVKGVEVKMNAEAAPIIEKLGGNPTYFESESCAFKGLDKQYDYGSYVIYTYPLNDVDYILSVELKDDTVEAEAGLCIGSAKEDVTKAMGDPTDQTEKMLSFTKGKSSLQFLFTDNVVTSIQYMAVTD